MQFDIITGLRDDQDPQGVVDGFSNMLGLNNPKLIEVEELG